METNTIRHKFVGDTTIDEDTELHGMIAGTVTVAEGHDPATASPAP